MCAKQSITSKAVILAWLLFLCLFTGSNAFAYDYQVTEIQPLPGYTASRAMGINNLGEVVGRFYNLNPSTGEAINRKAFVWDPTNGAYLLPTLSGECSAWGINDNGFAVGYSYNASAKQRAVLWDLHVNTIDDIGALRNPTTLVYGESSTAYGINNLDQVVGSADIPNNTNTFTPFHAFLDDTSGISDLGTLNTTMPEWQYGYSIAYCINNNGQVVGIAQDTPWAGFIYDDTDGMRMLPKDPAHGDKEWYAVVINDSGLIGGHVIAGTNQSLPYYWPNESTPPVKITMPAGFPYGEIYGINASGQMVGIMWSSDQAGATEHAFIFDTQKGVRDLNNLIDPASGWVLRFARDINDRGKIVGYGELNGNKRGFVLTIQSAKNWLACAFNSAGIWEWDSGVWSRITRSNPQSMAASSSILYADFGADGIYKYESGIWSRITPSNPESMVASGSMLYADFGADGIYKYESGVWSRITPSNPQSLAASGSILYADFGADGIYKYESGVWSQITTSNPAIMAAGY
jgi:probable HAF family extracellular repeat protein